MNKCDFLPTVTIHTEPWPMAENTSRREEKPTQTTGFNFLICHDRNMTIYLIPVLKIYVRFLEAAQKWLAATVQACVDRWAAWLDEKLLFIHHLMMTHAVKEVYFQHISVCQRPVLFRRTKSALVTH